MKQKHNYTCRICESENLKNSAYPDAIFNDKTFEYLKCNVCHSFNVFPSPNEQDFSLMYGENDHDYLDGIGGKIEYNYNYPFAHYHGFQIKCLDEINHLLKDKTLLDYACGSGFYMNYAKRYGAKVVGIEFSPEFSKLLRSKTNLDIYTFDEVLLKHHGKPFDFIHLGHVLEHLPDPKSLLIKLKELSHNDTVFLIDGPLERNACLHRLYVDFGSRLKNKKTRSATPQHLTLTTQKSQLLFFERLGLKSEKYWITEQYFPLPSKLEPSIGKAISFLIASTSIVISKLFSKSGNIFHFRGILNEK